MLIVVHVVSVCDWCCLCIVDLCVCDVHFVIVELFLPQNVCHGQCVAHLFTGCLCGSAMCCIVCLVVLSLSMLFVFDCVVLLCVCLCQCFVFFVDYSFCCCLLTCCFDVVVLLCLFVVDNCLY